MSVIRVEKCILCGKPIRAQNACSCSAGDITRPSVFKLAVANTPVKDEHICLFAPVAVMVFFLASSTLPC